MSNLEEIIKNSTDSKQVAKYYSMLSSHLLKGEVIERIEIEVNFSPKALVLTNLRIIECKSRSFSTYLEILFYAFWKGVADVNLNKGSITDDYIFTIAQSNVTWKSDGYDPKISNELYNFIANRIKKLNKENPDNIVYDIEKEESNLKSKKDLIREKLKKLKELFDDMLITEDEYQSKKNEVLKDF